MTNYARSLRLTDANAMCLAEILMPDYLTDQPVLLMPTMGMYHAAQADQSQPFVRTGPHRMIARSFLAYLAGIAAAAPADHRLALHLSGIGLDGQYYDVGLARNMQADDLAMLTCIPLDDVREFLANHMTFPAFSAPVSEDSGKDVSR